MSTPQPRGTILLVEDHDDFRRTVTRVLHADGYRVVHAVDGTSAVSVGRRENPDLVLLDMGLPAGDGVWVLGRYANLAALCAIPVIVLTGRDRSTVETQTRDFAVAGHLTKPLDQAELLQAVEHALHGNPAAASPSQVATLATLSHLTSGAVFRARADHAWGQSGRLSG
jgi:DNA-binding response OmpR family regulator